MNSKSKKCTKCGGYWIDEGQICNCGGNPHNIEIKACTTCKYEPNWRPKRYTEYETEGSCEMYPLRLLQHHSNGGVLVTIQESTDMIETPNQIGFAIVHVKDCRGWKPKE